MVEHPVRALAFPRTMAPNGNRATKNSGALGQGIGQAMLLGGINHIAIISKDAKRLGNFYRTVFDAEVGPTRDHGPGETMTNIKVGPGTELNVFVIDGNAEVDRQTPMWGRGRIDHIGFASASPETFETIRARLIAAGAGDGKVNDFGAVFSTFFRDPDGLECEVLLPKSRR